MNFYRYKVNFNQMGSKLSAYNFAFQLSGKNKIWVIKKNMKIIQFRWRGGYIIVYIQNQKKKKNKHISP